MKESTILLAIPMESELLALKEAVGSALFPQTIGEIAGFKWLTAAGPVFVFPSKVGRVNIAADLALLSQHLDLKLVINLGSAGSIDPAVKPLDVVVATRSAYYDVDLTPFGYKYGQMSGCPPFFTAVNPLVKINPPDFKIHSGLILSADSFITAHNINHEILRRFEKPLCLDMEGAAVGQMAYRLNCPYILIRAISDEISAYDNASTHEMLVTRCCRNAVSVLLDTLSSELEAGI